MMLGQQQNEWQEDEIQMLLLSTGEERCDGGSDDSSLDSSNYDADVEIFVERGGRRQRVLTVPKEWLDGTVPLPTDAEYARWVRKQLSQRPSSSLLRPVRESSFNSLSSLPRSGSFSLNAGGGRSEGHNSSLLKIVQGGLASVRTKQRRQSVNNPYRRGDGIELSGLP